MPRKNATNSKDQNNTLPPKAERLLPSTSSSTQEQDADEPLFFYMPNAKWGEFCQWYPSKFTVTHDEISKLVGDNMSQTAQQSIITFNCAEQFMMYCKAARFHDTKRQARILATDSPKVQKQLGKLTVGFSAESWDEVKSAVVEAGSMAKFSQKGHLQRKLLATGDRLLCEAASRDRVWGIGYAAHRAMPMRKHWGENRLGKALMVVRERLKEGALEGKKSWELWEEKTEETEEGEQEQDSDKVE
ncbi:hypothetical protein G7046_g7727 [Stylonectria norvegica]|nr:hypothetical protein G7046_g7727 [Stylonectria norvegica]